MYTVVEHKSCAAAISLTTGQSYESIAKVTSSLIPYSPPVSV